MNNYQIDVKAKGLEKFAHQEIHDSLEMKALLKKIQEVLKNNNLNKQFSVHVEFIDNGKEKEKESDDTPSMDVIEDEVFIFEDKGYY